jgi:hypothetical protein
MGMTLLSVEDEDKAVVAIKDYVVLLKLQGEVCGRDAIRRIQRGNESYTPAAEIIIDEAKEGGLLVVGTEAVEEMGLRDEAAPPLADERGTEEGGRKRREAEEELGQEVAVLQRRRRRQLRRARTEVAVHLTIFTHLRGSILGRGYFS